MDKYVYRAKLVRVVDGDTFDAMIDLGFDTWIKRRIRLKGVDTWESRTRDKAEKKKGLAAKARTKEILLDVSCDSGLCRLKSHGTGKYGRVLGEIYVKDIDGKEMCLNQMLVDEGHAYIYNGGKKQTFKS